MAVKLTIKSIEALPEPEKDHVIWDSELTRFGLRVKPGSRVKPEGHKTFIIQYRNQQGRSRKLAIGTYGTWTPDTARNHAKTLLRQVDMGGDPGADAKEARHAITVADLCEEYLKAGRNGLLISKRGTAKKPITITSHECSISTHIIPRLGNKVMKDLKRGDVHKFFQAVAVPIGRNKKQNVGGPFGAKRAVLLLSVLWNYAEAAGYIIDGKNPCKGIALPKDNERDFRLEEDGWKAFGASLRAAHTAGEGWRGLSVARLIALTGCRRDEIEGLFWHEVDFEGHCFRFDPERVKTGAFRAIGEPALAVLKELYPIRNIHRKYVFPGVVNPRGYYSNFSATWAKFKLEYSPHGLRHAFASTAEEDCGIHESTIGALLGHGKHRRGHNVTRGYIRKSDRSLIAAADLVSGYISKLIF